MNKALILVLVLIIAGAGFLGYDWYAKTHYQESAPAIPMYSWTDAKGATHYSDSPPPRGATNVKTTKGYKHVRPPLILTIKEKAIHTYSTIKKKLLIPKKEKKSSGKP